MWPSLSSTSWSQKIWRQWMPVLLYRAWLLTFWTHWNSQFRRRIVLLSLKPVSYTHLDVYKRQDANDHTDKLFFHWWCPSLFWPNFENSLSSCSVFSAAWCLACCQAVSYPLYSKRLFKQSVIQWKSLVWQDFYQINIFCPCLYGRRNSWKSCTTYSQQTYSGRKTFSQCHRTALSSLTAYERGVLLWSYQEGNRNICWSF